MVIKLILYCLFFIAPLYSISGNDAWIQRANFGSNGRHRAAGFSIGNKGYIGLGHYNGAGPNIVFKDWWEFDPATNSWSQKADYNGNNGNGDYGVSTFSTPTKGYIAGGQLSGGSLNEYNPVTNTWSLTSALPLNTSNVQGFSIGNKLYLITGNALNEFNTVTGVWTAKNPAPFTLGAWNSTFTIDNKGYVKSGYSLWEYKPTIDQWTSRAAFPGLASGGSVGFTQHNLGFIVSGYQGSLANVNSEVWEFNPGTNSWIQRDDFYGSSRRFSVSFSIGDRCYMGTGTNGTNFNDFWEFNRLLENDELTESIKTVAYPNPAIDQITIKSDRNLNALLEIVNQNGKVVKSIDFIGKSVKVNREDYPSGVYYFQIIESNQIIAADKFIFQ
jgi:N-acetylneuraminic acid mutarotase